MVAAEYRASLPISSDAEFLKNLSSTRSFSQNPRWKRHASLDAGVGKFRSRMGTMYDSDASSPTSSSFGPEEEKRLLHDFPSPLSPWGSPTRPLFERKKRSPVKTACIGAVLLILGAIGGIVLLSQDGADDWWGVKTKLEDYGVPFKHTS